MIPFRKMDSNTASSSVILAFESSFWVTAAERHLAEYLWEHNDWPPDGNLRIDQLTLDDIDMAGRWNVEKNESSIW